MLELDCAAIAARILRPDRSRLEEARTAVAGISSPREAWSALAGWGLIPRQNWFFAGEEEGAPEQRWPHSIDLCVALAADPAGAEAACAHAREATSRLGPWGVEPGERDVVWRSGAGITGSRARALAQAAAKAAGSGVASDAERARIKRSVRTLQARPDVEALYASWDAEGWLWWQLAVRADAQVPEAQLTQGPLSVRRALHGRRFRDLPNPFEPLLEIWKLGYALCTITEESVVLSARPLEP